jgi:hypothetical protein
MPDHDALTRWLDVERASLERELRDHLRALRAELDRTLEALEAGDRVDEGAMLHAPAIAAMLGRWNLARDAVGLVAPELAVAHPIEVQR